MDATERRYGQGPSDLPALHGLLVGGRADAAFLDTAPLRRIVADSWQRSLSTGVDPDRDGARSSASGRLADLRATHPLTSALPVIRRLLVEDATDSGVVVAVSAADGTLLWVEGDRAACRRAEAMNFVPGADWSEEGVGTNAPGTALAIDREVQIHGSEHFSRIVQPWSCTAVPVHDPVTGVLIGAIDLTGGTTVGAPQTLALVRATAVAVENHLALLRLRHPATEPADTARMTALGAERPCWRFGAQRAVLTGRHADILVLLGRHPEGLSADHLAVLLDDRDLDVVTVRAEVSRLRRVIGPSWVASRPYRLLQPVASDVGDVFEALAVGDVRAALSAYTGALLPQSVSPGVARLRTELSASVREAVLAANDVALLRKWLLLPEARDDRHSWRLLCAHPGADAVARAAARGHLAALDSALA